MRKKAAIGKGHLGTVGQHGVQGRGVIILIIGNRIPCNRNRRKAVSGNGHLRKIGRHGIRGDAARRNALAACGANSNLCHISPRVEREKQNPFFYIFYYIVNLYFLKVINVMKKVHAHHCVARPRQRPRHDIV